MGDGIFWVLPIALIAMMALSIFSQKKRSKQVQEMHKSISVGDTLITIGGYTGIIVEILEDEYIFECEGTRLRIKKWAISSTSKNDSQNEAQPE